MNKPPSRLFFVSKIINRNRVPVNLNLESCGETVQIPLQRGEDEIKIGLDEIWLRRRY